MRKPHSLVAAAAVTGTVMLLSVTAYVGISGVANAQAACGENLFCIWPEPNFGGEPATGTLEVGDPACANLNFPTLSAINNTSFDLIVSEDECGVSGGRSFFLGPGEQNANFPYAARSISRCTVC